MIKGIAAGANPYAIYQQMLGIQNKLKDFNEIDTNADNSISKSEFSMALESVQESKPNEQINKFFSQIDDNQDGSISRLEHQSAFDRQQQIIEKFINNSDKLSTQYAMSDAANEQRAQSVNRPNIQSVDPFDYMMENIQAHSNKTPDNNIVETIMEEFTASSSYPTQSSNNIFNKLFATAALI